eukprot:COSAG01_NODE_56909_length_315_cov_1.430556_1_plen_36_part_10
MITDGAHFVCVVASGDTSADASATWTHSEGVIADII